MKKILTKLKPDLTKNAFHFLSGQVLILSVFLFPFLSQVFVGPFRGPFGKEENHLEFLIFDI